MNILVYTSSKQGNQVNLQCSDGRSIQSNDWQELSGFLLMPADYSLIWNVDRLFSDISSVLTKKQAESVTNKRTGIILENRKVYYQTGRTLGINHVDLYSLKYYADKEPDTIQELSKLAYDVIDAYKEFGIVPGTLSSPVASFSKQLEQIDYPRVCDLPESAWGIIEQTSKNPWSEWRELYKIGAWESGEVSDFDMRCYSEDTEALTIDGWKLVKDLSIGELILGFNKDTNKCQFQPVKDINISHYKGDMYRIIANKIDLLVTPNHRVLYRDHVRSNNTKLFKKIGHHYYGEWLTREIKDTPNGNIRLPISYPIDKTEDLKISDDILKIIAWVNTEGWISYNPSNKRDSSVNIEQSEDRNSNYCIEIANIITNLNYDFSIKERFKKYVNEIPLVKDKIIIGREYIQTSKIIRIKSKSYRILKTLLDDNNVHFIPMWILKQCSLRQLRLYYDTLMKGDGTRHYKDGVLVKAAFTTKYKENVDRMQYLCHLLGYRVSYANPDKEHNSYNIFINETRNDLDLNYAQSGSIKIEYYDGVVACPTIESGYMVIRRNRKSCISGNSCYPSLMSRLPDISSAKFFESDIMPDSDEYSWGEMVGDLTLKYDVTPFGFVGKKDNISITSDQLWLVNKYSWGDFTLKHGYFLKLPNYYRMPFKDIMVKLYQTRQNDSPIIARISKAIANGIGGKLVLRYDSGELSDTYNCIYGRMITTRASTKLADKIWRMGLQSSVISVLVDGFLAETKGLNINELDKGMGSWKVNSDTAFIVASLLNQWDSKNTKHPNGQVYDEIMATINKNPRSSIIGHDVDLNLMSHNRMYKKLPHTGKELLDNKYTSKPIVN
jgi:hypothetical protein